MELKDLAGKYYRLSGVDQHPAVGDEGAAISFVLDGITYTATEDPSDGYRSSMKKIAVSSTHVTNVFGPVLVYANYVDAFEGDGDRHDLLRLMDDHTGELVLEVGTRNLDDYYPGFAASFDPAAMAINKPGYEPPQAETEPGLEVDRGGHWGSF